MNANRIHKRVYQRFLFGSSLPLSSKSLDYLIGEIASWEHAKPRVLDGRGTVKHMILEETGAVVIKSYRRGGVMALLTKDRYLRAGKTRSQKEFEFLSHAARAGVSVPRPLIYIARGYPLYRAWLVTQRIKSHNSLATLAMKDAESAGKLMPLISKNITLLIKNKIFHVDLHPGNVIIHESGTPYIIDFDRARFTTHSPQKTTQLFNKRWMKAIAKYHLPSEISRLELDEIPCK